MSGTPETFKSAWITDLKSQTSLTSLVGEEIREQEYQSQDWEYPCIRVAIDFRPSINGCGPDDATVEIEVFSEEKSSKQAAHIASLIFGLYHRKPFIQNGIRFGTVIVREVKKPMRDVPAWKEVVEIFCQGASTT